MNTRTYLIEHNRAYPGLLAKDIFKFLYQSAFGCEHAVTSYEAALAYIRREAATIDQSTPPQIDRLDGSYSRVHLSWLNGGLRPETLARMFCLSAQVEEGGHEALQEKLAVARELIEGGKLSLDLAEFDRELALWAKTDYSAVHHSEAFRAAYRPAYRVISNRYAEYLPLFARIDRLLEQRPSDAPSNAPSNDAVIVAIEGGSANGKTTLAETLRTLYGCDVFHTDDFFLRPEQRTAQRLAEVGGNLDRERFFDEVVTPLTRREAVRYRPFNCATQALEPAVTVMPKGLTVVEGAYSMHPAFGHYYDLAVFLDVPADIQRERILKRNSPQLARRFFDEWIPMEHAYFDGMKIRDRADIVLSF